MTTPEIIRLILLTIIVIINLIALYVFLKQKGKDIALCEEVIKKNSLTFYKAFSKINDKRKREAVYAVYAFCRYADDLIDENQDLEGLMQLKIDLDHYVQGRTPDQFFFRALKNTTKDYYPKHYDYSPFYDMIKGQEMDAHFKEIKTEEELLSYCYYVAGSVGLMLTPILSKQHKLLTEFAVTLGYAMQITNILRDIGEDYERGRVYLPTDLLKQANYSNEQLSHGIINSEFINMFEHLAKKAENYYKRALADLYLFPNDVKVPLGLAIILYREIIQVCRENKYDVFTKKNFVTDDRKEELIKTYLKSLK
jgi:phytoene synthase